MNLGREFSISVVICLILTVKSRLFNPKTGNEFQKAIDASSPGDMIQLEAMEYQGDFLMEHNGEKGRPIQIIGRQQSDGSATTQILANLTGIWIRGDYWFLKDLNISAPEEGIVIEGSHNHVESLAIHEALQAISVLGNENEFGSLSISSVREGIIVQGSDNVFRDISMANSSSGILIEKGDRNNLHNLAIHNNVKEGLGLLLEVGTCCGRLTNVILDGLVEVKGSNYYFRQTIASEGINILGCNNTFGRSVFSRTYFTKDCQQIFRSSNIYHYPQTKCMGCCISFLTQQRQYVQEVGPFHRVTFPLIPPTAQLLESVASFVKVPKGGRRGQIATHHDLNLGVLGPRAFQASHTYQLYSPTNIQNTGSGQLSIGFPTTARLESVAIDVVTPQELSNIYLNYADGALVELYRAQRGMLSLNGICCVTFIPTSLPDMTRLTLNYHP